MQRVLALPLVRLLRRGSDRFTVDFAGMVTIAGIANALVLAFINVAAENASNLEANTRYVWLFGIALATFLVVERHVLVSAAVEVEQVLHRIRLDVSDRIRRADLLGLERIGRSEIYASVNRETVGISQAASTLVIACQSSSMLLFSSIYLAWLSRVAFLLTLVHTGIGLLMHFRKAAAANALLEEAVVRENHFFDRLTDLLNGFKEVRLHHRRGSALFDRLRGMSAALSDVKMRSAMSFAEHYVFAQTVFYLLIAGIVFVLPQLAPTVPPIVMKATAAVLFIIGPLTSLVGAIPIFARANVAAAHLEGLERELEQFASSDGDLLDEPPIDRFTALELRDVTFHYAEVGGQQGFAVGPMTLTFRPGETVFVIGGNGSGKSTFLKVLTGLYRPGGGEILIDGRPVDGGLAPWYRQHFSAVFSDYHLFEELFGLEDVAAERVNALLREMRIDHKTRFEGGRFVTIDLSAGQRKRLALLVALLEDRPIIVFDEWAADQEPTFRRHFYEHVVPSLREQGKAVIAVTHDDRYFDVADRVLKMEDGQFVEENVGSSHRPSSADGGGSPR